MPWIAMAESLRRGQTILDKFAIEHAAMLKEAACLVANVHKDSDLATVTV